jgi:short-subunit dehydrogenase
VHPGHIGTNIAATARMSDEDFENTQSRSSILTKNAPKTQQEMGELFREGGMHPSKAAKIILNGVKKNKSRIFIGLDARLLDLSQRLFPKHYHKTWLFFIPLLTMLRNKKPLKSIE